MATITVDVTQEDIDGGERGDCKKCPIARALARTKGQSPEVSDFEVSQFRIQYQREGRMLLPEEAQIFVRRFDNKRPVSPFSFTLEVPDA
jgi:hypothetical protein